MQGLKVTPISDKENEFFHKNFKYMWEKMSITHYHAKQENYSELPARSVLSACYNQAAYKPPRSVIERIVAFYNKNIVPETDMHQFLNEDLEAIKPKRKKDVNDERFLGVYYCYYPALDDSKLLNGAILSIHKRTHQPDGRLYASILMGLRSDDAISDAESIFNTTPNVNSFNSYFAQLEDPNDKRCSYYEGEVQATYQSLQIPFFEPSGQMKKFTLTLNIKAFVDMDKKCDGALGMVLRTADGSYSTTFHMIGIIRRENGCFSLSDERVKDMLKIKSDGMLSVLTTEMDRNWFKFILKFIKENKEV